MTKPEGRPCIALASTVALAEGLQLGETNEHLKLQYEVSIKDHGTGRITATFTLAGRRAGFSREMALSNEAT